MTTHIENRTDRWQPEPNRDSMTNDFDRFELLSAYLDGEVTPQERRQIQQWLDSDPQFHQRYTQLLRLHQGVSHLQVPPSAQSSPQLADQVFEKIDTDNRQKRRLVWGCVAITTVIMGILSQAVLKPAFSPQLVKKSPAPESLAVEPAPLMIALHEPVIEIPVELSTEELK